MRVENWKHTAAVSGTFLFTYGLVASMGIPAIFVMVVRNGYGWEYFLQSTEYAFVSTLLGLVALISGIVLLLWGTKQSKAMEPKMETI